MHMQKKYDFPITSDRLKSSSNTRKRTSSKVESDGHCKQIVWGEQSGLISIVTGIRPIPSSTGVHCMSAGADCTSTDVDSTSAGNDCPSSGADCTSAGAYCTSAGNHCTSAGADCMSAGADCTSADVDCMSAGADCTSAGADCTSTGIDCTSTGNDCRSIGVDVRLLMSTVVVPNQQIACHDCPSSLPPPPHYHSHHLLNCIFQPTQFLQQPFTNKNPPMS